MHITSICPHCETSFQLNPDTLGKVTRCPRCNEYFEVRAADGPAPPEGRPKLESREPPPPPVSHRVGSVGDIVPLLSAEAVAPEAEPVEPAAQEPLPAAPARPSWQAAPPPVRKPEVNADKPPERDVPPTLRRAAEPARPPQKPPTPLATPRATSASWQAAAPPVRKADTKEEIQPVLPPPARSWRGYLVAALFAGIAISAAVILMVMNAVADTEPARAAKAQAEFEAGRFPAAAEQFQTLARDFPDSSQAASYRFHEALARFLNQNRLEPNPVESYEAYVALARKQRDTADFKKHTARIMTALVRIAGEYVDLAEKKNDAGLLAGADAALRDAERLGKPGEQADKVRQRIETQRAVFARADRLNDLRQALDELASNPTPSSLDRANDLLEQAAADLPNVRESEGMADRLQRIYEARRKLIRWRQAEPTGDHANGEMLLAGLLAAGRNGLSATVSLALERLRDQGLLDDAQPVLWVAPPLRAEAAMAGDEGQVAFALARGVLYALERGTGKVLWARRVGPDVRELPVRLPGTDPELMLVTSSAPLALTARAVATGKIHWRVPLESVGVGQPVLLGPRAYLPTQAGRVHVIDLIAGQTLGYYEIGQPLGGGAVAQPGTSFLYVPADVLRLFVLDLADQNAPCPTILTTGHPAGALRGAPQVLDRQPVRRALPKEAEHFPDLLLLSQAAGLDTTSLRAFALPIARPDATPLAELPASPGWTWLPAHLDGEHVAQVTDRGQLTRAGIRQPYSVDPQLFRDFELPVATVDAPARAGIAFTAGNDFWLFCGGELHTVHFDPLRRELVKLGRQTLGAPLHAAQPAGSGPVSSLIAVTQALNRPTCLASGFEITHASPLTAGRPLTRLHWQRQLGLAPLAAPLVTRAGSVLILDEGGCLLKSDVASPDRQQLLAGPTEGLDQAVLLPGLDEQSAFIVAQRGKQLLVWHYRDGKIVDERIHENPAALASAPRASKIGLILPLADGKLRYLGWQERASAEGPAWRARHADRDAPGFVVALPEGRLLSTDGSRGLLLWDWPGGAEWKLQASGELPARIVSAPLVLKETAPIEVLVADAAGGLSLLRASTIGGKGTWQTLRTWPLGGAITAGPFDLGKRVGCVVDGQRLVCLDPGQDKPLWEYRRPEDGLTGQPVVRGDQVLVLFRSGRILSLDAERGVAAAAEIKLPAGVAPASGLRLLPDERVFLILSDGTIFVGRR